MRLSQEQLGLALVELGVHPEDFHAIRRAPFPHAQQLLDALKEKAKHGWRQCVLLYHPDRTNGDADKEEKFKVLRAVADWLVELKVAPHVPAPVVQRVGHGYVVHRGGFMNTTAGTGATTAGGFGSGGITITFTTGGW